jgi:hypothetical protein
VASTASNRSITPASFVCRARHENGEALLAAGAIPGGDMTFEAAFRAVDPWAADIYRRALVRGCWHNHAVRILARAWLRVIWRCWQDHVAFDPALHRARQPIAA